MRYARRLFLGILLSAVLAGGLQAATPRPTIKGAPTVDKAGRITVAWDPRGLCSFSIEILNASMKGRIYFAFLKCGATKHKTTERFGPGPKNQGRIVYVRVNTLPRNAAADCLKHPREPLCLKVSRSPLVAVKIKPRPPSNEPVAGTGSKTPAIYDGSYEVYFEVTDSGHPLARVGQRLGPLAFSVKNLALSGDVTGKIDLATGLAKGPLTLLDDVPCEYEIGFVAGTAGVVVTGKASCLDGLFSGAITGSRK